MRTGATRPTGRVHSACVSEWAVRLLKRFPQLLSSMYPGLVRKVEWRSTTTLQRLWGAKVSCLYSQDNVGFYPLGPVRLPARRFGKVDGDEEGNREHLGEARGYAR